LNRLPIGTARRRLGGTAARPGTSSLKIVQGHSKLHR